MRKSGNCGEIEGRLLSILVFVIIILVCSISSCTIKNGNERTVTCTVTDKGIKTMNDDGIYLIYTKDSDGETMVLQIADTLIHGRFDSSDLYAEIEVGKTYEFDICGERVPFLSWYPNILSSNEIR